MIKRKETKTRRSVKKRVVTKRKPAKRTVKKVVRRKVKRRNVKMSTRKAVRRRTSPKRKAVRRSYRSKGRSSGKVDIQSILINGAIAGGGAFVALWVSNKVNEALDKYTQGSQTVRNLIALGIAVGGSMLGFKYLDKEQATSLSAGMVAGIALLALKTSFGVNIGLAGDAYKNPLVDYTLEGEGMGLLENRSSLGMLEGRLDSDYSELNEYF